MGVMTARRLLALDASAGVASVALFADDTLVGARRIDRKGSAELLAPTITELLASTATDIRSITDIAVGGGPGSFTGLRVAAALGKGIARGNGAVLHAVPSLPLILGSLDRPAPGTYLAVLDALRAEWFVQQVTVRVDGSAVLDTPVQRLTTDAVRERAASAGFTLVGPPIDAVQQPDVKAAVWVGCAPVERDGWEPDYGRLAEAQVQWEAVHRRALSAT